MSDTMFCTEQEVKDILINIVKSTDEAPHVFTAFRTQAKDSFNRTVTFVIQTKEGNETLINAVMKASIEHDRKFRFVKSDLNVQDGRFEVDFLMIEAEITPNLA